MPKYNTELDVPRQVDENVLKTILRLHLETGHAYAGEVAERLNMARPTTYTVIKRLAERGDVVPLERGLGQQKRSIVLTPAGKARAQKVLERHETIKSWLTRLGVPEEEAEDEACHMEHGITDNTMALLRRHVHMATAVGHGGVSAAEIMQKMLEKGEKIPPMPEKQDLSGQVMGVLDDLGGLDGAARKAALVGRFGGEKALERLLAEVEAAGGVEAACQGLRLTRALTRRGSSPEEAKKQLDTLAKLGSPEDLKKLREAADKVGGVKPLLKLVNAIRRVYEGWSQEQTAQEP